MTEIKIGDKVELLKDFSTYKKGEIGIVERVGEYGLDVMFDELNGMIGYFSMFKLVVKLPQQLITDEEKEFLRNYEFDTISIPKGSTVINAFHKGNWYCIQLLYCKHKFNGLEREKEYTKQELGL